MSVWSFILVFLHISYEWLASILVRLSVWSPLLMSVCLLVRLFVCMSVCTSVRLLVCGSVGLLSICLYGRCGLVVFVCLLVSVSVFSGEGVFVCGVFLFVCVCVVDSSYV